MEWQALAARQTGARPGLAPYPRRLNDTWAPTAHAEFITNGRREWMVHVDAVTVQKMPSEIEFYRFGAVLFSDSKACALIDSTPEIYDRLLSDIAQNGRVLVALVSDENIVEVGVVKIAFRDESKEFQI